jgi:hypothetical protein
MTGLISSEARMTRREMLAWFGATSAAFVTAALVSAQSGNPQPSPKPKSRTVTLDISGMI